MHQDFHRTLEDRSVVVQAHIHRHIEMTYVLNGIILQALQGRVRISLTFGLFFPFLLSLGFDPG